MKPIFATVLFSGLLIVTGNLLAQTSEEPESWPQFRGNNCSGIAANGYIYLSSHNGIIKVIKAGEKPEVVSETKLEGKILATPAIVGNNLYVRTSEHLYAFQK